MGLKSIVLLMGMVFSFHAGAEEIRVAVAANFKSTLAAMAAEFSQQTGHRVIISSAASGVLYTQIVHGAPFDLFLSADAQLPQQLEAQGLAHGRFTYALGRLGLWYRDNPAPDARFLQTWRGDLALANPQTAPYGAAAIAFLRQMGIDPRQFRLLTGANVSQAYQFVASGNAEVGLVAWSNVVIDHKEQETWLIPMELHPPIAQQGVILRDSKTVVDLITWLQHQGQKKITEAGYALPPAATISSYSR